MTNKKINKTYIFIVIAFAIVLFGLRYAWLEYFSHSNEVSVENGEVFLTDYEPSNDQLQLVGDWAFYPNKLIDELPENKNDDRQLVHAPGRWADGFDGETIYGYGTYHLRIHVNPDISTSYSMRMYSIRSASNVIVNGKSIGKSGVVSDDKNTYTAFNKPYNTSSMHPDEDGIIDVFVQASNYTDPRSGGIIRSVYFGSEESIESATFLSSILQIFASTIFTFTAILALVIYFVGIRNTEIIFFSLGLHMLSMMSLNAGDEKIIMQFINMDYVFSYKLSMITLFVLSLSVIQALRTNIEKIHRWIVPTHTIILLGLIGWSIITPMEDLVSADGITMGVLLLTMLLATIGLIHVKSHFRKHIGLVLASVAIINHLVWYSYALSQGTKVIYYPFDLVIAVICFSTVWFKHYYDMNVKSEQQAKRLAKADKEKDLFLANISHELKNPLHSILNMSSAVLNREEHQLHEESKTDLEMVLSVSRRMSMLVNDLLELSMLDNRKPKLFIEETSLPGVVEGTIHMNAYLLEGKDVTIINKVSDDFPYVLVDENRLTQILYNLIHNAVKFTERGSITIEAYEDGNSAHIHVIDTGVGIDKSVINELFTPYRQGEVPYQVSDAGGLGLGLYIAKQLIEHMSGEMDVESTVNKGTTFTFSIPLANESTITESKPLISNLERDAIMRDVHRDEHILQPTEQTLKGTLTHERTSKIIVIDDDPINLHVIESVLLNEPYDIATALSGKEALQLLAKDDYDLIISDVMMPHMSGFELTKRVRSRFTMSELPILLITSRDRINDIKHGFDVGANDYVTKPIDTVELKARVQALADVRHAARESIYLETAFLQAQIQPHFIFNVINSIMALSEIDIHHMQELLGAFSDVLRSKFQFKDMKRYVDLKEELKLVDSYLYIEQVRFGDRLKVIKEIDDIPDANIPPITIQPLVENAVLHGITSIATGGTVTLKVIDRDKCIEVVVADNGKGMPKHILKSIQNEERVGDSGVGVYNTNLRLKRAFGKGLHIESEDGKGTTISFKIPKTTKRLE